MKKLLALLLACTAIPAHANVAVPIDGSYVLVFDDEFNGSTLNAPWSAGWYGTGIVPPNTGQTGCFDPANVSVSGGHLNLAVTAAACSAGGNQYSYHAANVQTGFSGTDNTQFTYGYFESRVYLPASAGSSVANWPAFWTSGASWPATGEIDIAEGNGNPDHSGPGSVCATWHGPPNGASVGGWCDPNNMIGWHVYGALWTPGSIKWYYDGKLVQTVSSGITSAPQEIILTYVPGLWGGPDTGGVTMLVDYVHVYQQTAAAITPQANYCGAGDDGTGTGCGAPPPPPPPPSGNLVQNPGFETGSQGRQRRALDKK